MDADRIYKDLGKQLHHLRKQAGLTQSDLASRVGLNRTSITNIEKGRQHIPFHMVFSLADAVGVNPMMLLPEINETPSPVPSHVDERISRERGLEDNKKAWVGKVITSAMKKEDANEKNGEDGQGLAG